MRSAKFTYTVLGSLVLAGAAFIASGASAQSYPTKPITVIVPVAAGGAADALARAWGDHLGKALGQPVVIDNKAGANGTVAASYVAKQPANGYVLLFGSTSNMSLNPFSYKSLPYNPVKDFDPVSMIAGTAQVLVINPSLNIKTLADFVAYAKANPGKLNYGSAGKGNSTHLNVEFVAQHFGLQMTHAPYKGAAPAMMGLIGGETQLVADAIASVVPQARLGKVVPIVVFDSARSSELPDVPTVYEAGVKEFPGGAWYGVMAPKGTPAAIIDILNTEIRKFWADPSVKVRMQALYMEPPVALGSEALAKTMKREGEIWGPIIKRLGIQND